MPWVGGLYKKGNFASNGWTGDAANNIGIEAGRHDTQDDDFASGINQCLNKDGSNAATGNLNLGGSYKITNLANGTASTDSATYGQVLSAVTTVTLPPGCIQMFGGASAPAGFLLCDGAPVSRTSYAALFAVIGSTYGAGDGTTTFNVPNFQQRFPLGKAASGTGSTLGGTGGAIDHTHTSAAHSHTVYAHTHGHSLSASISHTHAASAVTGAVGGADGTHEHTTIECRDSDSGTAPIDNIRITGGTGTTLTATSLIRSNGSGHGHSFAPGQASAAGQTFSGSSTVTGSIGAGSNNGDVDQVTSTVTPGATGANNPPFLTVNYIIKT